MAQPPPSDLQSGLSDLLVSLEGLERARYLGIATLSLSVYDMILTFNQEVEYFWKGSWTITRVLFFINRYFPPIVLLLGLIGLVAPNMSVSACTKLIHATFLMTMIGTCVVQSIIVLRICYVYSKDFTVRACLVASLIVATVITCVIYGIIWHDINSVAVDIPGLRINSCTAPPSRQVWKLFLPNLVLHTILFSATTVPAIKMRRIGQKSRVMDRLVRDGGIFYFVVFGAAMFSTVGSMSNTPMVTIPAIYSNLMLAMTSVSVSRLMLNIRSLASRLSMKPNWLLNNAELSRVNWKPGHRNGELIVEMDAIEDGVELTSVEDVSPVEGARTPVVRMSRVGVLEHTIYPGTRDYIAPKRERPKKPKTTVSFDPVPPVYQP